jgi:hypothetical protein
MFIQEYFKETVYERASKCGKRHTYTRKKRIVLLKCDNCSSDFERPRGSMDPKRLSNSYYHVCSDCDAKKFAQEKGIERKKVWDMKASSLKDISLL